MNALAGTGKTTMLRDLASHKKPDEKWLYLVFNKKNQVEASTGKGKFPEGTEVLTSHAFLGKVLSNSSEKGGIKHTELWHDKGERLPRIIDDIMEHETVFPRQIIFAAKKTIKQLASLSKAYAISPKDPDAEARVRDIVQKYRIDTDLSTERYRSDRNWTPQLIEKTLEALHFSLPENAKGEYAGLRDHDDTLWYAATNEGVYWPHYDVVLADEVQDFNKCQSIMLKKLSEAGARIVAVGDPHQCHPAGTMIHVTGGKTKPIEEINIGEEVVTYNSKKSYFPGVNTQGRKVLNKVSRSYSGKMITITTENELSYQCTPNHRCFVRFNPNSNGNYVLYLMIRKNNARIGIAKIKYFETFGPTNRARQEGADKLWALETFESEYEARINEAYISSKFGLPQTLFKYTGQGTEFNQKFLDTIYSKIGNNIRKAKKCIESFGRHFEFPLWTKENQERFGRLRQNYIGSKKSFVTQACNLMSGIMQVRTFDGTPKGGQWESIRVSYNNSNCTVYSLEVEHTEDCKKLYIANGIVTHNSIYMFRGADSDAFENVTSITTGAPNGGTSKPLPVNYRCGKEIIEYVNQNTHVKNLQAGKDHEGEVTEGMPYDEAMQDLFKEWSTTGKLSIQTAFISRTNQPLVNAALHLLKNNMEFQIIGRDFSKELIEVVERVTGKGRFAKHFPTYEFTNRMGDHLNELEQKWKGKLSKMDELAELRRISESLTSIVDYLASMDFKDEKLKVKVGDTEDFIDYLRKKFSGVNMDTVQGASEYSKKDPKSFVTLTTAHRSKGLEFSRVYILGRELFPHPKAKTQEELDQENNAWYVALTRAMNALHVLAPMEKRASVWVRRNCRFAH